MKFSRQLTMYESEASLFLKDLKVKIPDLEAKQRSGRALLWDQAPIDPDTQERALASRVRQQAYVYLNKG